MGEMKRIEKLPFGAVIRVEVAMPDGIVPVLFKIVNKPGEGDYRPAVVMSPIAFSERIAEWKKLACHFLQPSGGGDGDVALPVVCRNGRQKVEITFDIANRKSLFSISGEAELFETSEILDE